MTGTIVDGKELPPGTQAMAPYKVAAVLTSNVPIEQVTIGGALAQLTNAQQERWEATLTATELEANRQNDKATLPVVATDQCGETFTVDTATPALGPSPGVSVSNLQVAVEVRNGECYVPSSGGGVAPVVRVTASAASVGATVALAASIGGFPNGMSQLSLVLGADATGAEASTFYVPGPAGIADVVVSAKGVDATASTFVVAAPPTIVGPTSPLVRGQAYSVVISSAGKLDTCEVDSLIDGAATVTEVLPHAGVITGTVSVAQPSTCMDVQSVRLTVALSATAPDAAGVTIRCLDTYQRAAAQTFTVAASTP